MAKSGLAARLYRGEADLNIVGRRKLWFGVAGVLMLIAVLSFAISGFKLGIEFAGGNSFQVPASVGTLDRAEQVVEIQIDALDRDRGANDVGVLADEGDVQHLTGDKVLRTFRQPKRQKAEASGFGLQASARESLLLRA